MTPTPEHSACKVDDVLITDELSRRPPRRPDYEAESRALVELVTTMAESPTCIFQKLADVALRLCQAGSSGVSVWEPGQENVFRWRATAGDYTPYLGGTMPRDFSPCGTVLDRDEPLLMADPIRYFPYIEKLCSPVREVLLVPFYDGEKPIGTVWVVAHSADKKFDAEDARVIKSLTKLAGAAAQTIGRIEAAENAERFRRQHEEHFRALVTTTSDIVYRMSADWAEMQPLDGRGLIASNAKPIRDWMEKNIPAFEHQRIRNTIENAIHAKQPFELEHQVIRADGSLGWTSSRAIPVLDRDGGILEWFGTASDITRRKRAEEALADVTAESERRKRLYEAILAGTPDLVYIFGLDYRFLYANNALLTMWGKSSEEAIGRGLLELGYEDWHAEMHHREIEHVRATKETIRGEVPFNGTHGRRIYEYIFVPVIGADGEVEAVAGTTRDVTDRKRMEDELRDSDRKKDDFIALLAHELRNPLGPIRNGLEIIRMAGDKPDVIAGARGMMDRQLGHMVRLIDDLLDVSRISRNKMELRRENVSLSEAISSAVETAQPMIDAAGHHLNIAVSDEPMLVDADLTRLAQIIGNLLTNSAKYTKPGGEIRLRASLESGDAVISVKDNGIGIPPEYLPRIFEMFSQVDRSAERTAGGLGIGLALVRGLVEMHGGTVIAQSEGEGRGSEFIVRLPCVERQAAAHVSKPELTARKGRRVLVVDDNRDGAESLAMMLGLLGDEVRMAHDGIAAVETANEFRPQLILMDVGMPNLNGLDATGRIRSEAWGKEVLIIALTGWGQESDRERSRDAGCDGHLVKPVELADLERMIGRLESP